MVGSAASDRGKEAVGMMALHEALRAVCLNSDWTYSVFWTIRPRPRVRGGTNCKVGDDNGSLMLMWEDGFCRGSFGECLEEIEREDPVRKAFSKMSIQLYNYGEGLMGKVASDKCHKWVFKEPAECEPNVSNYWQSSFDAIPPEWTDQFESGIQTIAVIQAGHGLLQLGSCKIVPEDLHFVLRMRHTFESLGYQSGFYLSHLFSSNRNASPSSSVAPNQALLTQSLPPLSTWGTRPLPSSTSFPSSSTFQSSARARLGFPQTKDETHIFLFPNACETGVEATMRDHGTDIKWPNGLTFFNALSGRADDAKPFSAPEGLGNKPDQNYHPLIVDQKNPNPNPSSEAANVHTSDGAIPSELLKLVSQPETTQKMENKFRRSFTLPARMASPASSTPLDQHLHDPVEHRNSEEEVYSDAMETLLE